MNEARNKPTAWEGLATYTDRFAMLCALEFRGIACPRDGAERIKFDDARKIGQVNKLWDAFKLDEEMRHDDRPESIAVSLPNDLVRFALVDIIAARARFSAPRGVLVFLPLVRRLLSYAAEARVKLREREDSEGSDSEDVRVLELDVNERKLLWLLVCTPAACTNKFETHGQTHTLACPNPADGPRTVRDLEEWVRLFEQLGFGGALNGEEVDFGEDDSPPRLYTLDLATGRLLLSIILGRLQHLERGARRLGGVIADLEAFKNGGGKLESGKSVPAAEGGQAEASP